ncbi:GNAT family N-acetyltransferase [Kitasatospora sp. NPDC059648]|uniref:GNAT family N-acetyltransferase n=1 Tax=Kitasatospora sp. NPDC059648 TaxID=3346894 RepID=UPI003673984B
MDDLVTERLILHPLTPRQARRILAGTPGPEGWWAPGYPADGDLAGARRYLQVCAHDGDPQPFGAYEIRLREDGRAIGGAGFHAAPGPDGTATVGYGLIPAARGHGYATEALRALLELARTHGAARVVGDTDLDNTASQRVMAAAGMRPAGRDAHLAYYESTWPPPPAGGTGTGTGPGNESGREAGTGDGTGVASTQAG